MSTPDRNPPLDLKEKPLKTNGAVSFSPASCRPQRSRFWPFIFGFSFCLALLGGLFVALPLVSKPTTLQADLTTLLPTSTTTDSLRYTTYGPLPRMSQRNFFAETLQLFQAEKVSFIEADLSKMELRYHENGQVVLEVPIRTKGREGSWWETPAGLYSVEYKSERHFSSFGNVYTPWNLVFQGNFFIHGWPTYPSGEPVSSQYSGGCIRLDDADAEALFKLVKPNTAVLVYEDDYTGDGFVYAQKEPVLDASAYLVADLKSATILASKNATTTLPIASITKLMTGLIASEYINLDKDFTITEAAMASTSIPRLTPGMTMSGYSLLLPLLLESSNVAANALANITGPGRFVSLMNKKAGALGMKESEFVDPSGIGNGNISTASDLLALATYIYHNRSFLYAISTGRNVNTAYTVYDFGPLQNFNVVPGLPARDFMGGKVGKTTAAKETIVAVYNLEIQGETRPLVFIVLGAANNYEAVAELYEFIQLTYTQ